MSFAPPRPGRLFRKHAYTRRRHRWSNRRAASLLVVHAIDGDVTALLYLPWIADLPPGWRHSQRRRKSERLIGLDRFLSPIGVKALLSPPLQNNNKTVIGNDECVVKEQPHFKALNRSAIAH